MAKRRHRRSAYAGRYLAVIGFLLLALIVAALVLWPRDGGLACATGTPPQATVTLPPTTASTSTTSTTSTTLAPTTTTESAPVAPLAFDGAMAMSHIEALASDIGPRKSGTAAEDDALGYATTYLQSLGYDVQTREVLLPGGQTTRNVMAVKQGQTDSLLVIGGHIDTKAGAPGANDNASGVAVVLELARDLRDADILPTVEFVVFAAEEMTDSNVDHHHYGSRQFFEGLTADERAALVGMISVDMVGYGSEFTVRTMNRGPQLLREMVRAYSNENGLPARFLKDTGHSGMSDHEAFELAGYPAVWVEWRQDPKYHTAGDTYAHCDPDDVRRTGEMLLGFLSALTQEDLQSLAAARQL